uniref:ATP synthase F0 subunit 8 n=1 Tax=Placobdella parasitica TaxID=60933 RepID=A0A175D657_9ANNE|nr:ATP synthase F0 subunit 8 [Placobdella parasitica]
MPHLSPMSWILFLIIMWVLMTFIITNMWWFMYKPMNSMNEKMALSSTYSTWKW